MTLAQFLHETYPWTSIAVGLIVVAVVVGVIQWRSSRKRLRKRLEKRRGSDSAHYR